MKTYGKIIGFICKNVLLLFLYFLLFICCRKIIGTSPAITLIVIFNIYGSSMAISYYGQAKLIHFEKTNSLTIKNFFGFSVLIASPIYSLWLLVSIIPIFVYEVWFITGFPIILLTCLPLYTLSNDHCKPSLKKFFWILQMFIYLSCLFVGQLIGTLILPK